jgi:hypothetical protein
MHPSCPALLHKVSSKFSVPSLWLLIQVLVSKMYKQFTMIFHSFNSPDFRIFEMNECIYKLNLSIMVKGKVKLSLCSPWKRRGREGVAPRISNLTTNRRVTSWWSGRYRASFFFFVGFCYIGIMTSNFCILSETYFSQEFFFFTYLTITLWSDYIASLHARRKALAVLL